MKLIAVLLIACLVVAGLPTVAPAQVVTTEESGESDDSGGSEASNTSLLLLGATVFAGDIALRAFSGNRLFPMAAPIGGSTMILGWLTVALAAGLQTRGRT